MKKLITFLIFTIIAVASYGQQLNPKGMYVGKVLPVDPNSKIQRIDSITVDDMANPTNYKVYHGADTLESYVPVSKRIIGSTLYVKLLPDTVHVTDPTYTVLATDASKVHVFYNDFTLVTIAAYATQPIPVGTWTTFISKGGKVRFTGTNVHSELDSLTINLKGAAQLFKIGQNDNLIFGGLLN